MHQINRFLLFCIVAFLFEPNLSSGQISEAEDCPYGFDRVVDFDTEKGASESNVQALQRLLDCPSVKEITFTLGATYDIENVVDVTSLANGKTLTGNGAILRRSVDRRRIFRIVGAPEPVQGITFEGFVFDTIRWRDVGDNASCSPNEPGDRDDFHGIIHFITGNISDITITNNLFIQSENTGNLSKCGSDSWMVNVAAKRSGQSNVDSADRIPTHVENINISKNVCIARGVGFTAGGGDGLYKNIFMNDNIVIRSEIAVDCTANVSGGGSYENVNLRNNEIINPARVAIHVGLDSDGIVMGTNFGANNRSLAIDGLYVNDNTIRYGARNSDNPINAIICRPGTTGLPKQNIEINDNLWTVDSTVDNDEFTFQHIGTAILTDTQFRNSDTAQFADNLVEGVPSFAADTQHRQSGTSTESHLNYKLDLSVGQYPTPDRIPVPPIDLSISNNIDEAPSASRIKLRGLNDGNREVIGGSNPVSSNNCSTLDYTKIVHGDVQLPIVTITNFRPHVYRMRPDEKYPVISEAIDIDADEGFEINFKFYSRSFCGQSAFFWQDDNNYIRIEPRPDFLGGSSESAGSMKVRLDGNNLESLTGHSSESPFREHTSYHISIVGQDGVVTTTVRDVFELDHAIENDLPLPPPLAVPRSKTFDNFNLSLKSIGAAIGQIASAHNQNPRTVDGYLWDIEIKKAGEVVAYFPGYSPSRDNLESWGNTVSPGNDAVLMGLNTFDFDTTGYVSLSDTISVDYSDLDLSFKLHARKWDNRVVFYGATNHMLRLESTGRLKLRNDSADPVWQTVAEGLILGNTYDISIKSIKGSVADGQYMLQTHINGELNRTATFDMAETETIHNLFRINSIGGPPNNSWTFAKPFDGLIWDIKVNGHQYAGAGNDDVESWLDEVNNIDGTFTNY